MKKGEEIMPSMMKNTFSAERNKRSEYAGEGDAGGVDGGGGGRG